MSVTPEEYPLAFPYISVAVVQLVWDPPEIHDWLTDAFAPGNSIMGAKVLKPITSAINAM